MSWMHLPWRKASRCPWAWGEEAGRQALWPRQVQACYQMEALTPASALLPQVRPHTRVYSSAGGVRLRLESSMHAAAFQTGHRTAGMFRLLLFHVVCLASPPCCLPSSASLVLYQFASATCPLPHM